MANQKSPSAKKENKKTTAVAKITKTTKPVKNIKTVTKASSAKVATKKAATASAAKVKQSGNKSKMVIWVSVIVVVVVAVVAGILIWNATRLDYNGLLEKSDKLGTEISAARSDDSCQKVYDEVQNGKISNEDYDKTLKACKDNVRAIEETMRSIEKDNVVKKNSEAKTAFDKLKSSYDKVIPEKSEYELSLDIYKTIHESMVEMRELEDNDSSDVGAKEGISAIYDVYKHMADRFAKLPDDEVKEFSTDLDAALEDLAKVRDQVSDSMSASEQLSMGMELQKALSKVQDEAGESSKKVEEKAEKLDINNFDTFESSQKQFTTAIKEIMKK